jgi:hypothetical protein
VKNQGHPVVDLGLTRTGNQAGCAGMILALIVLGLSFVYLHEYIGRIFGDSDKTALKFASACGSPPNSGSTWHSVIGYSQSIDLVKSRYCGDAFITSSGQLQVASFTSMADAKKFADALSKATGRQFWVSR